MASVSLSDLFNTLHFTDYDHAVTDSVTDRTIANYAINLRSFNDAGLVRLATQADLDNQPQPDTETQGQIENIALVPGENWTMISHTNTNAWGSPPTVTEVGKQAAISNWCGAAITLTGGAVDFVIGSNMDNVPINISTADFVSLVASGNTSGVAITIYLEDSVGGNSGFISLTKQTPANAASEWRATIGSFTGLDLTRVTRVQIHVTQTASTAGAIFRIFAIRAYKTGFDPSVHLGLHTQHLVVEVPVTFDLTSAGTPALALIRGRGQPGDPSPENVELRALVDLGTLSGSTNTVSFIYRQTEGADTYVRVVFSFNQTVASYSIYNRVAGVETAVVSGVTISEWPTIRAAGIFWLAGKLIDDTFQMRIYISDANEEVLALAHDEALTQYALLVKRRGRIGWSMNIHTSYDTYLRQFQGFAFSYSTFITGTNNTITPIEAVQLKAAASADSNLFTTFVSGATFDTIKTLSGAGSWAGYGPAISNQFVIDDFAVTYIKFDIWVPTGSAGNPYISLRPLGAAANIYLPAIDDLQPGIWNSVEIELSQYDGLIGVPYELHIADLTEENPLTWQFNIDNMMVGRRNVAWFASVDDGVNWYEFRDAINDDDAALHFPRVNAANGIGRGTQLKFRAEARSIDAWVASFAYKILYAQLGRPTYYV